MHLMGYVPMLLKNNSCKLIDFFQGTHMISNKRRSIAIGATLILMSTAAVPIVAQAGDADLIEEIIVTGSAIKRPNLDQALPIQILTAEDIVHAGVTNIPDLMATVPAMQNTYTASDTVGGTGGGIRTANLRGIGDQYTLSLINGRRMAPADSGSTIDLSNIPLSAIERVEILTDGASALYGSDAIAGVVNFVLKDSVEGTTITTRGDLPEHSGGENWGVDVTTGFGNLFNDGFSIVATYSHDRQESLSASDRSFAETGFIFFDEGADSLYFQNSSANSIPGNTFIYTALPDREFIRGFNPYGLTNGSCAAQTTPDGDTCRFDYTSTLEILPEHNRDTVLVNGKYQFSDNMTGFLTASYSSYVITSRIAPYPSGEFNVPLDSQLVIDNVLPHLTAQELADVGVVTATWRALPASNRTTEYDIETFNFTVGVEGEVGELSYSAALTHSVGENEQD